MCCIYKNDEDRHELMSRFVNSDLQGHEKIGGLVDLGVDLPPVEMHLPHR